MRPVLPERSTMCIELLSLLCNLSLQASLINFLIKSNYNCITFWVHELDIHENLNWIMDMNLPQIFLVDFDTFWIILQIKFCNELL